MPNAIVDGWEDIPDKYFTSLYDTHIFNQCISNHEVASFCQVPWCKRDSQSGWGCPTSPPSSASRPGHSQSRQRHVFPRTAAHSQVLCKRPLYICHGISLLRNVQVIREEKVGSQEPGSNSTEESDMDEIDKLEDVMFQSGVSRSLVFNIMVREELLPPGQS